MVLEDYWELGGPLEMRDSGEYVCKASRTLRAIDSNRNHYSKKSHCTVYFGTSRYTYKHDDAVLSLQLRMKIRATLGIMYINDAE